MNIEAIRDVENQIVRLENQLEATDTEETLSHGAVCCLSSQLDQLYDQLYELEKEDD